MDLDGSPFRAFLAVAKHQSFTRAATEMNFSQPALSAMIRELERRLGFALFTRTSRHVELTREGRDYLVNAKRVVLEHDWAKQRAKELRSNDLRLAVPPYSSLISSRIALTDGYMDAFADIDVQIAQISSDRIYDAIRKDDADIGIVLEPAHRSELSPVNRTRGAELEALAVESRALGLFVPRGHAMAELDAIPESLLNGLPIAVIGRVHGGPMASAITRYLEELGADPVRIPEGDFISTLRHAGRQHIAAVDTGWFDCFVKDDAFVQRPIEGNPLRTELLLVRSLREQRSASDHFWRRAEQAFAAPSGLRP
jgi:DNA-binding transcriptional LysR family regulator